MGQLWRRLPADFLDRLSRIVPPDRLAPVLEQFSVERPTTLRANTLKISAHDLMKKLARAGIAVEPIEWYPDAFILKNKTLPELTETQWYQGGYLYVQSLSSMIPVLVLDPKPGEKVLDLTAAPGSKTTQMAALMANTGEIVANDNSPIRRYRLDANLRMQGVTNARVLGTAGQILWQEYPEYFDKTLVDVPCSMEGRFSTEEPKSYEHWSIKKIKSLVERQGWLLRSAVSATKPGGVIVYSTCTLAPEENEGVIDWILRKEKGAVIVEPIGLSHLAVDEPVLQWKNTLYNAQVKNTIRILPTTLMEGFFVAKLQKIASTVAGGITGA